MLLQIDEMDLNQALRFIGLDSSQKIAVEPTTGYPAGVDAAQQRVDETLRAAAHTF